MFRPASGIEAARASRLLGYTAVFLLLSYLPFLAPAAAVSLPGLMIFWSFFCSTVIILCDAAVHLLAGRSLLADIAADSRAFLEFAAAGTISGILLDGVAQWIGKLWIYPYWTTWLYAATFALGFCAYWLLLAETYLLGRVLVCRAIPPRPRPLPARAPRLFRAAALLGAAATLAGLALAAAAYRAAGGYVFEIRAPSPATVPFACFPLIFCGVWLLLEFLQYRLRRASLLVALFRGEWQTLAALLAASWIFGLFMETVNTAHHFWRYTHWPLPGRRVFGVPVVVVLLWPLQYVVFLSVYQAISGKPLIAE